LTSELETLVFLIGNQKTPHAQVACAVKALRRGGLVVFPTETVYGIAGDPRKKRAVRKILDLKGRHRGRPMTLQVASRGDAYRLVRPTRAFRRLAQKFWPGPLTLIARSRQGRQKVGIRIPSHPLVLKLLRAFQAPLVVTSLNPSGKAEVWQRAKILKFVHGRVDVVFLEKRSKGGRSSTVCDLTQNHPLVFREGRISRREIFNVLA